MRHTKNETSTTTETVWANDKGFRVEDFIKPAPFTDIPDHELPSYQRVGKYNARIVHADLHGIDPRVDITTPDFDTEAEARTHALNLARNTPGANQVTISRLHWQSGEFRMVYPEVIESIALTNHGEDEDGEGKEAPATPIQRRVVNGTSSASLRQRTRRNTLRTAVRTNRALGYRTLSGRIAAAVEQGRLVKTGDFLERIGGGDLKDGVKSWFGRHVATAYRKAHGGASAVKVWAQHRTTGHWNHVYAYGVIDEALYTGLFSYKGTQHLLAADYARCA